LRHGFDSRPDCLNTHKMAQQTAVEWLVRKLSTELIGEIPLHRWDEIREAVQQAKQMEKFQIMEAWMDIDTDFERKCAEQYYNETYGKP